MQKDHNRILSANDILNFPIELLPAMVLSDNLYSFFSFLIKLHEKGQYNHFMVMLNPGVFLSQDLVLHEVLANGYLQGKHRLKIVVNTKWNQAQRSQMIYNGKLLISIPLWRRLYDWPQLIGFLLGARWLNIPGRYICSDIYRRVIAEKETGTLPECPSPPELDRYFMETEGFSVYGRFNVQ